MKTKETFIVILLITLTVSCNKLKTDNQISNIIDIESNIDNMKRVDLSEFSDNILYVPFDTIDNINLGYGPSFDISEDLIVARDMESSLIIFDRTGRFIVKFGNKGRGPEEYLEISNLCFGKKGNIFFSSRNDLFEFNSDGSFHQKYSGSFMADNEYFIDCWHFVNDSSIFGHVQNDTGQSRYKAVLIDNNGRVIKYYRNFDLLKNEGNRFFSGSAQISEYNNTLFFKEQFVDTLFSLDNNNELIPEYIFNLGRLKIPAITRSSFIEYVQKIYDYVDVEGIYQTSDYLFLSVNLWKRFPARRKTAKTDVVVIPGGIPNPLLTDYNTTNCLGIYNKETGEFCFCEPTSTDNPLFTSGLYNDIDGGPRFFPAIQVNDSTMVMSVTVMDLKNHIASNDFKKSNPKYPEKKQQLEELVNSLSEFANPVLMVVTLKK